MWVDIIAYTIIVAYGLLKIALWARMKRLEGMVLQLQKNNKIEIEIIVRRVEDAEVKFTVAVKDIRFDNSEQHSQIKTVLEGIVKTLANIELNQKK
jgi:predicted AAA+ superfamily ATPase